MVAQLAGLTFTSKAAGYPDPSRNFRVHKALEGWTGTGDRQKDKTLPISPVMLICLVKILPVLRSSEFELGSWSPDSGPILLARL